MKDPLKFITAGNSNFTVKSLASGKHFTYKVKKAKGALSDNAFLVFVLTGPDNNNDYTYMGMLNHDEKRGLFRTKKSRVAAASPSWKAFNWIYTRLAHGKTLPDCELKHVGRCGRCGRKLTHPDSLDSGVGKECAGKL